MLDLFREILQTLRRNRLRTVLTGVSVAWGVFMLIVLLAVSRGVLNATINRMDGDRYQSITVYPGWASKPYKGLKADRPIALKDDDLQALEERQDGHVDYAVATVDIDTATISSPTEYITGGITGIYPENAGLSNLELVHGRYINEADIRSRRKSMVLCTQNAEILFGDVEKAVGRKVDCLGLSWTIVGVYKSDWERATQVPFTTVSTLKGGTLEPDRIQVIVRGIETEEQSAASEQSIRNTLAQQHSFDPTDLSAVYVWNRVSDYLQSFKIRAIFTMAVWIIGLLTLLTGVVGVSNIMFVSVRERVHEIGLRRAIGARPRQILIQLLLESVVITGLFGYMGIIAGTLATQLVAYVLSGNEFIVNPTVDISIAVQVTIMLIIVGAIAGIFPAIKATKVQPVEALRDE